MSLLPPNVFPDTPGTKRLVLQTKPSWTPSCTRPCNRRSHFVPDIKSDIPWLISQFGDACSSSWLEGRYDIWRGEGSTWESPKVQGYLKHQKWVFAWGNPLCEKEKRKETAEEFVEWAKKEGLKVVWCCVDSGFEEVLAEGVAGVGWSTLSCLKEDVLHPDRVKFKNRDVKQNLRRAERADLSCDELRLWDPDYLPDDKTKKAIDSGLEAWRNSRQGRQIASASLDPWLDASNRRYFLARTPHEIVGICILTPIAGASYQIKNAIPFPSAPRGTSEALLTHVIKEMKGEGRKSLTFGASATADLLLEHNIRRGVRMRLLERSYSFIITKTGLAQRGHFRSKFETEQTELLHISFPPHGFGLGGLLALMKMLKVQ
ncbi:hypothetical protein BCR35DRAFT_336849 [Leucosporidium creatinivorum]|uniref:Phosphatidylglycerol lysyltransferase C-terminal domain-containing protein n=1 Tax=Leucosporidium creatinivorum TaxID=106004 RepID=A0A1Y2G3M3_9BASI|nr:hypothetical protein BCR35DRAFT_336849 [Leucosporidium creatinivorum]